jgi:hypothetical protein
VQPRLCGVRQPEDKGKVERSIRYLRDRFFAGRYMVDIDEGNRALLQFFEDVAVKRQHPVQTTRTVGEVFAEERERLLSLPDPLPSTEYVLPIHTDRQAFVRLDTNRYSVPLDHADRALSLAFDDHTVRVLDGATELARHARSYGRNQVFEDPAHRAEALRQRRAATDLKGRDRLRSVTPLIDDLLECWVDDGRLIGPMCFRLGRVFDLYGATVFAAAVEDALDTGATDFGALNVACERRRRHFARPVPLDVSMPAHIPDRDVIPHSLENYDE